MSLLVWYRTPLLLQIKLILPTYSSGLYKMMLILQSLSAYGSSTLRPPRRSPLDQHSFRNRSLKSVG
jgi:hypothetical protein